MCPLSNYKLHLKCSYTLGHSEMQCAAGSKETQLVPLPEEITQGPSSQPDLPSDSVLLQRIAQLESDMIKVLLSAIAAA